MKDDTTSADAKLRDSSTTASTPFNSELNEQERHVSERTSTQLLMPAEFGSADCRNAWGNDCPDKDGNVWDHYEVINKIGDGAFGTVYQVASKDKSDTKHYALKHIMADEVIKAGRMDMFKVEVLIAKTMSHPNIVWLVQSFRDNESISLVMEMVSGRDLCELIPEDGLGTSTVAMYLWQMLSAVAYIHYHMICHRDIKPDNWLVENSCSVFKSRHTLKLIDFGLSKVYEEGTAMTSVVGTLRYTAPEVLKCAYTVKVDIWSIGIVVFMCLAGSSLQVYKNEHDEIMLAKEVEEANIKWESLDVAFGVSKAMDQLLRDLLTVDGTTRPTAASCSEIQWLRKAAKSGGACDKCCVLS